MFEWRHRDSLTSYCCPETLSGHSGFGAQVWCDSLGSRHSESDALGGRGEGDISLFLNPPVTPTSWVQVSSSARFAQLIIHRRVRVIYKQWRYTSSGVTQTVALHTQWRYSNSGASKTVALHKQWGLETVALHKQRRFKNGGDTQTVAIYKEWCYPNSGAI